MTLTGDMNAASELSGSAPAAAWQAMGSGSPSANLEASAGLEAKKVARLQKRQPCPPEAQLASNGLRIWHLDVWTPPGDAWLRCAQSCLKSEPLHNLQKLQVAQFAKTKYGLNARASQQGGCGPRCPGRLPWRAPGPCRLQARPGQEGYYVNPASAGWACCRFLRSAPGSSLMLTKRISLRLPNALLGMPCLGCQLRSAFGRTCFGTASWMACRRCGAVSWPCLAV